MLEFKKSELESVLLTICAFSHPKEGEVQKMISGLLMEDLTLGDKRRLQKQHKKITELYKEFIEDFKETQKDCVIGQNDKGEPIYDMEKLEKEVQELLNEVVKVDAEPARLSEIEKISSSNNYNFDIIEKIAV